MKSRIAALCAALVAGLGGGMLITSEASANGCGVPFTGTTYQFSLPAHFVLLASCDPEWTYTLTADVDLTGVTVGRRTDFTGTFDGNGYTISNLSVTGSGLFDVGPAGATFTRVQFRRATVLGGGGNGWAGALVREASGPVTISHSSFSGSVTAGRNGNDWAGGFIGDAQSNVTISTSYFSGSVTGAASNGWAGGFIGNVTDDGVDPEPVVALDRNYMSGDVTGGDGGNSWAAGFIGNVFSDSSIELDRSYMLGDVTGGDGPNSWAAGFIGTADVSSMTVTDSFVRASLAGGSGWWAHGFVGMANTATTSLRNSYFEGSHTPGTDSTSWTAGIDAATIGGQVLRTFCVTSCLDGEGDDIGSLGDLRTAIVGAGWDLTNTWCYSSEHNDGYPVLKGLTHGPNAAWGSCGAAPAPPPPPETTTTTTTSTTTTTTTVFCQVAPMQTAAVRLQPGERRIERGGVVVRSGLSGTAVVQNDVVEVRARGLAPAASIDVWLIGGRHFLGTLSTDSTGAVRGELSLPSAVKSGANTVQMVERNCNTIGNVVSLGVRLDTLAELPRTGTGVNPLTIVFGVLAIFVGLVTQRRRHIR